MTLNGPHQGQPVLAAGATLDRARAAMVMVHGRGATADSIPSLADVLDHDGFAFLAPQAAGNTWYPNRFLAPLASNEPWLSSAIRLLEEVFGRVHESGIAPARTILLGFSQGACLALEYAARHAMRYGGVVGLSGGLIGPDGMSRDYGGSLDDVLVSTQHSLLIAGLTILLSVVIGAPAGYALSRFHFPGKEAFRMAILGTKMFPATILAVPLAVAFINWGLYDTLLGVAFMHTALALPFAIVIITSVFAGVPLELEEAAMTLGCSRLQAFRRIALPIALPGLAAAAIFTFVLSWNEVFAATILTLRNRTLPALVMSAVGGLGSGAPLDYRFAAGFFMVIPALIIILIIRRYLLTLWGITVR